MEIKVHVPTVPKWILTTANQLYELEQKLNKHGDSGNMRRNVEKIKDALQEYGVVYEDPFGQRFTETRTDVEATISGTGTENLVIVEVIKPIIRATRKDLPGFSKVIQKGIVIVESRGDTQHAKHD